MLLRQSDILALFLAGDCCSSSVMEAESFLLTCSASSTYSSSVIESGDAEAGLGSMTEVCLLETGVSRLSGRPRVGRGELAPSGVRDLASEAGDWGRCELGRVTGPALAFGALPSFSSSSLSLSLSSASETKLLLSSAVVSVLLMLSDILILFLAGGCGEPGVMSWCEAVGDISLSLSWGWGTTRGCPRMLLGGCAELLLLSSLPLFPGTISSKVPTDSAEPHSFKTLRACLILPALDSIGTLLK